MEKIGRFEIVGKLGRGAFGMVYKGRDPVINRLAAIKVMSEATVGDPELVARFKREAEAAGGLNHKNIVTIYDLGEHNGLPYIAMEFLEGKDLEKILKEKQEISMERRVEIMAQTAEGLHYAHSKGIVHRDVKPANIRLLEDGTVKIMDFGIAKMSSSDMTRTGQFMGTVNYMSPEQIKAKKVDGRSDLFALGVMFYELISFRRPFPGDSITAVIYKIVNENPPPLSELHGTPHEWLEGVVFKCLEKDATKRWETCQEFADALRARAKVGMAIGESTIDQTINIARQKADEGDVDTAIRKLDEILEQDPENALVLKSKKSILAVMAVKQTDSLISSGRLEQARDQLLKALGDVGESDEIQKALDGVQDRIRSTQADQLLQAAQRYLTDKRVDAAIDALQKARELDPYNEKVRETLSQATDEKRKADVELLLADAKARLGQGRFQEAQARVQKALELDPHSLAARSLSQAIERDIESAKTKAEVDDAILQGRAALKKEEFDKAVALFDRALVLDPQNAEAKREKLRVDERKSFVDFMSRGQKLLAQKKYAEAAAAFDNAAKLDPASEDARLGLTAARQKRTSLDAPASRGVPMGLVAALVIAVLLVGGGLAWYFTRATPAALALKEGDAAKAGEDLKTAAAKYLAAATTLEGKDSEHKAAKSRYAALYEPLLTREPLDAKAVLDQVRSWDGADAARDRYLDLAQALAAKGITRSDPDLLDAASESYQTYLEKYDKLKDRESIKSYAKLGDDLVEAADNAKSDAATRLKLYDQAQKLYSFIDVTDPSLNTFARMNDVRARRTQLAERMDQITKFDAEAKSLVATAQAKEKSEATYSEAIAAYDKLLLLVAQNDAIRDFVPLADLRSIAESGKQVLGQKLAELTRSAGEAEKAKLLLAQAQAAEQSGQLESAAVLYAQIGNKAKESELKGKVIELSALKKEIPGLLNPGRVAEAETKLARALQIAPSDTDLAGFQSTLAGLKRTGEEQARVAQALKAADELKAGGKLDEAEAAYRKIVSSDPAVVASINRSTEELRLLKLQAQIGPVQKEAEAQEAAGNFQGALDGWRRIDSLLSTDATQAHITDLTRKLNQQAITQLEGELDAAFKARDAAAMDAASAKLEKLDPTNAASWRVRKARAAEAIAALNGEQAAAFLKGKRPNDPEIAALVQKAQDVGSLQQSLAGAENALKAANRDDAMRFAQSAVQSATRLGAAALLTRAQEALARAKALPDPNIERTKAAAEQAARDKAAAEKAAADKAAADKVAAEKAALERAAAEKAAADKAAADKAAAEAAAAGKIAGLTGAGDWTGAANALDSGSQADAALAARVYWNASRLAACDPARCNLPAAKAWGEKAVALDPTMKRLVVVVGGNWKSCTDPTLVAGCQQLKPR